MSKLMVQLHKKLQGNDGWLELKAEINRFFCNHGYMESIIEITKTETGACVS